MIFTKKAKTIIFIIIFAICLLATLVAEFFINIHNFFGAEENMFFHAWFGFLSCLGLVIISKFLGIFIKRSEEYYN